MRNATETRTINCLAKSLAARWPAGLTWDQLDRVRRRALSLAAAGGSTEISARAVKSLEFVTGRAVDGRTGMFELLRLVPKDHRRAREMIAAVRAFVVALDEMAGPAARAAG